MLQFIRTLISLLLLFSVLFGLVYPAVMTGFARLTFPGKARGSVISVNVIEMGSALIGQPFSRPEFFWGRPSATTPQPYNATASAGSNLGPLNVSLNERIIERVAVLRENDPGNSLPVPVDLVTASGSGLDPHISPAAAFYQVPRVARLRGLPEDRVRRLVEEQIENRPLDLFGEPRVNVLLLNLLLKRMAEKE
ncbi:MAG: potassium-transporting ATPase subunit KdpC [Myxococcales bacterium]|nr:potassium-transporting ATPase subunit KdpC [Myxococcales bacterium]